MRICSVQDCFRVHQALGLCMMHYNRFYKKPKYYKELAYSKGWIKRSKVKEEEYQRKSVGNRLIRQMLTSGYSVDTIIKVLGVEE